MAILRRKKFRDRGEIAFCNKFFPRGEGATRRNPYSGEEVWLCPLAVSLYDFIIAAQFIALIMEGERGYKTVCIDFERAQHIFRQKWPDEYMKLLD